MSKWVVAAKKADFNHIGEVFHISPVVARIIRNRDVVEEEDIRKYLHGTLADLYDPKLMKGMTDATALLSELIAQGKKIRVIGDYDVDGICATFILIKGLGAAGADVDYAIPHRIKDGYGINESLVKQAYEDGREVIITCDNGIAATDAIAVAKSLGMTVIVTDHHEIPYEEVNGEKQYKLPEADAVVDPKQPGDAYPNAGICGAVVAYKLLQVLIPGEKELLDNLLEIAAIATVGDVMELLDENRILVREGLNRLQNTNNTGLRALLQVSGLWDKKITAFHIGFVIGPCINATGRLDAADRALELLMCEDEREAVLIAGQLKDLNDSRKSMTEEGVEKAIQLIEDDTDDSPVLVVYLPECHESLAGIIAGRIKERYYKPTFVLTDAEDGIKGSGRSIPGYHMFEALTAVKDLLEKFGGHSMAAGVSLKKENLEAFRTQLNAKCTLTQEELVKKTVIDVAMPFSYCSEELIRNLELLEPFGNGNSKPVFAQKDVTILSERILGKNKNVAKYMVNDPQGNTYEMIYFGDYETFNMDRQAHPGAPVSVLYYPGINEFRGRSTLQITMQDYTF